MKMFSKNAFVFLLCVSVWGTASEAWAKDPQNLKQAQAYEERAFQYIKAEDWCGATNSFLDAYEKAPIIDYLFNAAKAARLAGDRRKAMQLNIELLGQFPGSPLTAEVNQNNKELSDEMTQSGPGLTCPRREASAAPAPAATIRPKETPSPTVESHETTTLEPVPVQPPAVGPSPAELPPAPKKSTMGMDPVTIGVLAAGGVLTTAGIWGVYWGTSSYLRGLEIHSTGEAYEGEYDDHKKQYESTDLPIQVAGYGALVGGLTCIGLGTWWVMSAPTE